jgi:hypothetical protein
MVDGATITQTDVMASNGVLHVVDKVLLPKDVPGVQAAAATDEAATMNVAANEQVAPAAPTDHDQPDHPTAPSMIPRHGRSNPAATPSATATAAGVNSRASCRCRRNRRTLRPTEGRRRQCRHQRPGRRHQEPTAPSTARRCRTPASAPPPKGN